MGQFIDEVSKINRSQNRADSVMQRKNNLKNEIYKFFNRAFKHSDDIDFTYEYYLDDSVKSDIMCGKTKNALNIYDACYGLTMEFCNTTYFSQLDKIYKLFKKRRDISIKNAEKEDISIFYIVFDDKGKMKELETYERHARNNKLYDRKIDDTYRIDYYKIYDMNNNEYLLKLYYFKDTEQLDVLTTTRELKKDGVLKGIHVQRKITKKAIVNALLSIPLILFLGYFGIYALIIIGVLLFIFLIILCS